MESQESQFNLFEALRAAETLPAGPVRRSAVSAAIREAREKSPLAERVGRGQTSFEEAIGPLVAENRKLTLGACWRGAGDSPGFRDLCTSAADTFAKLLPLVTYRAFPRAGVSTYDLTAPLKTSEILRAELEMCLSAGLGSALFLILWRWFAEHTWEYLPHIFLGGCIFGGLLATLRIFGSFPSYLQARRNFAELTLRRARFLDQTLKESAES